MFAKLEATFGARRKTAQQTAKSSLAAKIKAEAEAQEAIQAAELLKARFTEVENFSKLVMKWRVQAQKELVERREAVDKRRIYLI